jgi:hypothetical protein
MEDFGEPLFVARPHVRVTFHRKGPWLIGVAYLQGPSAPVVLTARANVKDLERAAHALVRRRAQEAASVGSLFGSISHAFRKATSGVEKLAKGKIARELYAQTRKVMKSPVMSAALAATSVVFPPVGIPVSAAFVTANKVLDNVEAGGAAAAKAKQQIQDVARLARMPGAMGDKARKVAKVLSITHQWRQGLKVAQAAATNPALAASTVSKTLRPPAGVRGALVLPSGRHAQFQGVERAGKLIATLTMPNGRKLPLRATVQGACGC